MLDDSTLSLNDTFTDANISTGFGVEAAEAFQRDRQPSDEELDAMMIADELDRAERELREQREDAA